MKTKNNVQQAILKSLAVVFSFVLISMTVNAQGFWKSIYENNGFKDIALAMIEVNTESTSELNDATTYSAFTEVESDEALELENWMMTETNFVAISSFVEESESALNIEDWMTDDNYSNPSTFQFNEETDNKLEIEDWMLNDNSISVPSDNEQPLALEDWMIHGKAWNN